MNGSLIYLPFEVANGSLNERPYFVQPPKPITFTYALTADERLLENQIRNPKGMRLSCFVHRCLVNT
jgi:hypothetical protein